MTNETAPHDHIEAEQRIGELQAHIDALEAENTTLREGLQAAGNMIERLKKDEEQAETLADAFVILAQYWEKRTIAAEQRTMET